MDAIAATIAQPHRVKTSGSVVQYCNVTANDKMHIFRIKIVTIVQSTSRLANSECFSMCPKASDFFKPECYGFETRGKSESKQMLQCQFDLTVRLISSKLNSSAVRPPQNKAAEDSSVIKKPPARKRWSPSLSL